MEWPQFINIIDDTEIANELEMVLDDLSWVFNPRTFLDAHGYLIDESHLSELTSIIQALPDQVRRLARESSTHFSGLTDAVKVFSDRDVEDATRNLKRPGLSISFVDFDYSKSLPATFGAIQLLYKEKCPIEWRLAVAENQMGGCYFSSEFGPTLEYPARLLCPVTYLPPTRGLEKAAKGSITRDVPIVYGGTYLMEAVARALTKWVEIQNICPLDQIWQRTIRAEWFLRKYDILPLKDDIPFFSPEKVSHGLPPTFDFESHRQTIREVFDLDLPERWWSDLDSIRNIHESLKHLCGVDYCGTPTREPKYNLCVGSVYFIALLAMRDASQHRDYKKLMDGIKTFSGYKSVDKNIFPIQNEEIAKNGARALYYLLKNLFTEDPKHALKDGTLPTVKTAKFVSRGRGLSLQFKGWSTSHLSEKIHERQDELTTGKGSVAPERAGTETDNIIPLFFDIWKTMALNSEGFGSPGSIWMDGKGLSIYSALDDGST
jgi:hypothetical protein